MAIDVTSLQPERFGFLLNCVSADASACEEILAAPGAGLSIVIDHITINSAAAISITIGAGETAGAVTEALIGPITFAAGQSIQWTFQKNYTGGMKLDANTALVVDTSGAGAICIFCYGRII